MLKFIFSLICILLTDHLKACGGPPNIYAGIDEMVDKKNLTQLSLVKMIKNIEKEINISESEWSISLIAFHGGASSRPLYIFNASHAVIFIMGKLNGDYRIWAADFMQNIKKTEIDHESIPTHPLENLINPNAFISSGFIRSLDDNKFPGLLFQVTHGTVDDYRSTWAISRTKATEFIEQIREDQNDPPYYNFYNQNPFSILNSKSTYNCVGRAAAQAEKATGYSFGLCFASNFGIRLPALEGSISGRTKALTICLAVAVGGGGSKELMARGSFSSVFLKGVLWLSLFLTKRAIAASI